MLRILSLWIFVIPLFSSLSLAEDPTPPSPVHGLAIMGDLKYGPDIKNFDYVNPDAPKGGTLRRAVIGTYDSFNPFVIKGQADSGVIFYSYGSLLARSMDEPSSYYGYVAKSMEMPEDRSWIIFNLRPEATFFDGTPVTADDVIYSFNILRKEGIPMFQNYYKQVDKAEKLSDFRIKFSFKTNTSRELPTILGDFPIFSKAYMEKKDFNKTTLDLPLSCGPYKVKSFKVGQTVTYERVKNWWGENIPIHKGRFNFDEIRHDYYRDIHVAFEAFKSHNFDFQLESSAKNWAVGYDFPAFKEGKVIKEIISDQNPEPSRGWFYNLRRPLFQDPLVRKALSHAFDFEWTNAHLFYNFYQRTNSFFAFSDLACRGLPEGEELEILSRFKDQLPPQLFTEVYTPPLTAVPSSLRHNLEKAKKLLQEAGWAMIGNKLTKDGQPFVFEILLPQSDLERVFQGFVTNLKRIGIEARLRSVDSSQYVQRLERYDYDIIMMRIPQSPSLGNEQREFWSSAAADMPGGYNFSGIKNPIVDQLIELLIAAPDRKSLLARTHALDRVLLWHDYIIQGWGSVGTPVAYWHNLKKPSVSAAYGLDMMSWWSENTSQVLEPKS
ncbi:MAG: extracellular solute-binding protein [Janthinobacterium lividum]